MAFDSEKQPVDDREKQLEIQEAELCKKGLTEAFLAAGGKAPNAWHNPNESTSIDLIQALFRGKLALTENGILLKNESGGFERHPNGQFKSLQDKMRELKAGSFRGFFKDSEQNQQQTQQQNPQQTQQQKPAIRTYTAEEARTGKASIDDIASGRAIVV